MKKSINITIAVILLFIPLSSFSYEINFNKFLRNNSVKIKLKIDEELNAYLRYDEPVDVVIQDVLQLPNLFKFQKITFYIYKQNVISNSPMYKLMGGLSIPFSKNINIFYSVNEIKKVIKGLDWSGKEQYMSHFGLSFRFGDKTIRKFPKIIQ